MAANTCTSTTATVTGTDASFKASFKTNGSAGVVLLIKYTKNTETGITITIDTVNPSIHATDAYRMTELSGSSLGAWTMIIGASGNYRIPIPIIFPEKTIAANITFSSSNQGGAVVANFTEA